MKKDNNQSPFDILLRIEKHYTPAVQLMSHLFVWASFIFILLCQYVYDLHIPAFTSLFLSVRVALCSSVVFYTFFYVLAPQITKYHKYYLFIVVLPLLVILWLLVNRFALTLGEELNIDTHILYRYLGKNYSPSYSEILTFKYILLNTPSVIFAISPFFFLKIIFDLTRLYLEKIKSEKEKYTLSIEKTNIEKQFLLAQLNPHFLFNTLNNIYGLIIKNDSRASKMVIDLSKIMKYTLYENNLEKVTLEKEISFMDHYFNINKTRYLPNVDLTFTQEIKQPITGFYIAPLITFVFLENAFKYGLQSKLNKFLHISIRIENGTFTFYIENDSDRLNCHHEKQKASGIGLQNVQQRLELIYPDKHTLVITEDAESFKVKLTITLE
ncbi:MAG: sensor histidine kinase [Chryseobacterium sp.]|uniref:sensor histidine kinase n=1 Tax=Chryseobacterium sp. TaxID=1871047 RepID=UPI0025C512F7|nr:sensor histidine kinase [Chryseobacterium sp.]MCJ7932649.1 sensor histidine kinase [Chryseobacterium sp.]